MAPCMKAGGKEIKLMGKAGLSMLTETYMMDTGKMIKHMDLVFTAIWMEQDMKGSGRRINSMERV